MDDLRFDIAALHAAYRDGADPADVMAEVFRRIDAADDPGIFIHLRERDAVLAEAGRLGPFDPENRPLWGLPFAIKDNIDLAEAPTTAACPAFAYEPERDAFVVATLRRAGAIPVGKTNLDQFATGLVGVRSPYPPPRNALDPEIVPGGSSSGSAVAVARDLVTFALGTDTAGSGRVPAALNGIVGLKPSLGALSCAGVVPACRTLDCVSVFARGIEDAYTVFRIAAVFDPDDAYARPAATPPLGPAPPRPRIAVPNRSSRRFFGDILQEAAFDAALARLDDFGVEIVETDFTLFHEIAALLYEGAWVAERLSVVADLLARDPDAIHPVTRRIVEGGQSLTAVDAFRGIYRLADLRRAVEPVLAGVDMLCVPTIPTFYSLADLAADPVGPNSRLGTYTNFVNLLDLCAISVPSPIRGDGRPGSVTLIGRAGRDAALASLAAAVFAEPAPVIDPLPGPGEITIAVVGAHMSGLPLNHQLTDRGGRFLRAARTSPDYRLFALPGGPPARPGLLRGEPGARIALEIWALPRAEVAGFLETVPAPLCLGSVHLGDGTTVTGFLCEHAATEVATDITSCGGWRDYLSESIS
jgi:allophanate hydrolase